MGFTSFASGTEGVNVNPLEKRYVNPSKQEIFQATVLPGRDATRRFVDMLFKGQTPWTRITYLTPDGYVLEPATGEVLGRTTDQERLDLLEQRVASLSYAIAEMQTEAIGAEVAEPIDMEWKEWKEWKEWGEWRSNGTS